MAAGLKFMRVGPMLKSVGATVTAAGPAFMAVTIAAAWAALVSLLPLRPAMAQPVAPAVKATVSAALSSVSQEIRQLPVSLLQDLSAAGLISSSRGEPVAAFTWVTETARPGRSPRQRREVYAGTPPGTPNGLSPVLRQDLPERADKPARAGVSVRGLMVVHPDDTSLEVQVGHLRLPLADGVRFALAYHEDGSELAQECVAGGTEPAASIFTGMPGSVRRIECDGRGKYRGIGVRVTASVLYFEALGVFLNREQRIDTPLGRLRNTTRIVSFEQPSR